MSKTDVYPFAGVKVKVVSQGHMVKVTRARSKLLEEFSILRRLYGGARGECDNKLVI